MSGGAGFSDALEVKPDSGADPADAASASEDPKPNGDAAEDRKAVNYGKQALKESQNLKGQVATLTNLVTQLVQRPQEGPQPKAATESAPDPTAMREALAAGDMDAFTDLLQKSLRHTGQEAVDTAVLQSDRKVQTRDFRTMLVKELNLADPNREENREIFTLADKLRNDAPDIVDPATSQLAASALYWKRIALGDAEAPESLRAERLDRSREPAGGDAAAPAEPEKKTIQPDWNARDRGLPAEMVQQLRKWGIGDDYLQKSPDPHQEQVARETIAGFLDDGNHGD